MSLLKRLFGPEAEPKDPIDTPIPHANDMTFGENRVAHFENRHNHAWAEQRVTAIEATCTECGVVELHPNHRGRIKSQKDIKPRKLRKAK